MHRSRRFSKLKDRKKRIETNQMCEYSHGMSKVQNKLIWSYKSKVSVTKYTIMKAVRFWALTPSEVLPKIKLLHMHSKHVCTWKHRVYKRNNVEDKYNERDVCGVLIQIVVYERDSWNFALKTKPCEWDNILRVLRMLVGCQKYKLTIMSTLCSYTDNLEAPIVTSYHIRLQLHENRNNVLITFW